MTFNKLFVTALCLIALSFVRCQKDELDQQNFTEKFKTSISGTIADEAGAYLSGVTVNANGQKTITDGNGYFRILNVPVAENIVVNYGKDGYFDGAITQFTKSGKPFNLQLILSKKTDILTFSTSTGGKLEFGSIATVNFSPNSVVTSSGASYSGTVKAAIKYIDPNRELGARQMPGGFTGVNSKGETSGFLSYGVIGVDLQGANGEHLQIKKGTTATLSLAVPKSMLAKAPATITLASFDATTGLWKAEHSASLQNGRYIGQVSHFSFWNYLVFFESVNISAVIKDKNNSAMSTRILVTGAVDTGSLAYGFTDDSGIMEGKIPKNTVVHLKIFAEQCGNMLFDKKIGPFSQDTDLGDLVLDYTSKKLVITGTVKDCNGNLLRRTPLRLYESGTAPGIYQALESDDNGLYSYNTYNCSGKQYSLIAYDLQNNKESDLIAVTELEGTVVKNIAVCANRTTIKVNGKLADLKGIALSAKIYLSEPSDTIPVALPTYTALDGSFSVEVPKNKTVKLNFFITDPCGKFIYEYKVVGPLSTDTDLGAFTIAYTKPLITVSGKLTDCNGNPVVNGTVRYGSTIFPDNAFVIADNNGNYNLSIIQCGQTNYTFIAYDNKGNKLSEPYSINNTGNYTKNFSICKTPDQYVKIESSNPTLQDELYQIVATTDSSNTIRVGIYEDTKGESNQLLLNLNMKNGTAGIFDRFLYRSGGLAIELTNGFTSNVVNLAQYPVASGGYYEGTFELKGLTKSGTTEKIDLTGTFRLRKY